MIVKAWFQTEKHGGIDFDSFRTDSSIQAAVWFARKKAAAHRMIGGELVDCNNPNKVWKVAEKVAGIL